MPISEGVLAQLLAETQEAIDGCNSRDAIKAFKTLADGMVDLNKYFDDEDIFHLLDQVVAAVETGDATMNHSVRAYFMSWYTHLVESQLEGFKILMLRGRFTEFFGWVAGADWTFVSEEWEAR